MGEWPARYFPARPQCVPEIDLFTGVATGSETVHTLPAHFSVGVFSLWHEVIRWDAGAMKYSGTSLESKLSAIQMTLPFDKASTDRGCPIQVRRQADQTAGMYREGTVYRTEVNRYERDVTAR